MKQKERIFVDGAWYVKEKKLEEEIILNEVEYEGIVVEDDEFCFKAERLQKPDGAFYEGIDFYVTNKTVEPWKEDTWDNNKYLLGILEEDEECMESLEDFTQHGVLFLSKFLKMLKQKGWFGD